MAGDSVYLDTSGVIAYLDADEDCHRMAVDAWQRVLSSGRSFLMTEWVRLECWSLLQRRFGLAAIEDFSGAILPLCAVERFSESDFLRLSRQILLMRRRDLSLVDLSSFDCMRSHGVVRAIAFDRHFIEQGFVTPESPNWK